MKTALECLACFMRQTLQTARIATADERLHILALRRVAGLLGEIDMERTPPENAVAIYQVIAEVCGCPDPYRVLKKESNRLARLTLSACRVEVAGSSDPLATALRYAIGANVIDYGAMHGLERDAAIGRCLLVPLAVDHSQSLLKRLRGLPSQGKVLYLADNCGEIVYDSLVVAELMRMGLEVTVVVKSGPVINDALLSDALEGRLFGKARILENGTCCPGTPLGSCSVEMHRAYDEAAIILSKGQGNFETLSEAGSEIFFLLTVKCAVVGACLARLSNTPPEILPGAGELVLFHYCGDKRIDVTTN